MQQGNKKDVIDVEVKDKVKFVIDGGGNKIPTNVFSKLQRARVLLQDRELKKSGNNKFSGFMYFELGDFLPHINEIFDKLGLYSHFYIDGEKATLTIYNVDNPEDEILTFYTPVASAEVFKKGSSTDLAMLPIQILGSQHTYLKRYLYLNALEIVEGDVLDATLDNKEGNYGSKATQTDRKPQQQAIERQVEQPNTVKGNATTTTGKQITGTFDSGRWVKAIESLRLLGWDYKKQENRDEVLSVSGLHTDQLKELNDLEKHRLIKAYGEIYMRLKAEQDELQALASLTEEQMDE